MRSSVATIYGRHAVPASVETTFTRSLGANSVRRGLSDVLQIFLLSSPKRLMVGYLLGAYVTSISLGLLIAFSLDGTGAASTSENTISPVEDLVIGGLLLLLAFVLGTGRDAGYQDRRAQK